LQAVYLPPGQALHDGCALLAVYLPVGHVLHGLPIDVPGVSYRPTESMYFAAVQLEQAVEV
jgi:hypothetical protein